MAKDISVFENEDFGKVRTFIQDGEPWFCLTDICKVLGLNSSQVKKRLDDGVVSIHPICDALNRKQKASFVNEDGLYDVILDSRKPDARAFRKWITGTVLPEIRRTGSYKGRSKVRIEAAKTRLKFTETLKQHGIANPHEYINITKAMKEPFGLQTKKKKDMTEKEVKMIAASEWLASAMLDDEQGYTDVKPVCTEASATVASAVVNKMLRLKAN